MAKANAVSSHSDSDGMGSIPAIPDAQNVPLLLCLELFNEARLLVSVSLVCLHQFLNTSIVIIHCSYPLWGWTTATSAATCTERRHSLRELRNKKCQRSWRSDKRSNLHRAWVSFETKQFWISNKKCCWTWHFWPGQNKGFLAGIQAKPKPSLNEYKWIYIT